MAKIIGKNVLFLIPDCNLLFCNKNVSSIVITGKADTRLIISIVAKYFWIIFLFLDRGISMIVNYQICKNKALGV